jgi:hypothetical protein
MNMRRKVKAKAKAKAKAKTKDMLRQAQQPNKKTRVKNKKS